MSAQMFHKGDLVQVAKNLGRAMSHFTSGCRAIVIGSYKDQYGGSNQSNQGSYTLHLEGRGETSWYEESQLTMIESGQHDLLEQWEEELKANDEKHADMNWVFANGKDVANTAPGASVQALAKHLGCTNLWGRNGEGVTYFENARITMHIARPFLETGDKDGYIQHCKDICSNRNLETGANE